MQSEITMPTTSSNQEQKSIAIVNDMNEVDSEIYEPQTAETSLKTPKTIEGVVIDPNVDLEPIATSSVQDNNPEQKQEDVEEDTVQYHDGLESEQDLELENKVRIKLDNIIGGTIPHLEAIISITIPKDKYKVIYDKLIDSLTQLSKLLSITQIFCEKEINWQTKDRGIVEYISHEMNLKSEHVRRGPNFYIIGFMLEILEECIFNPAFRTWPRLATTGEKISLYKSKMATWRKLGVFSAKLGIAMVADRTEIQFQKEGTGKWKKLNEVATFVTAMTEKQMDKKFDEINNFLHLTSAAHGKTAKVLINIVKMSKKELEFHMEHSFENYEEEVKKASREGYVQIWKKNNTPKLSSKLWKNVFQYMINQEEALRDLDLFIAFCNKDCIKVTFTN